MNILLPCRAQPPLHGSNDLEGFSAFDVYGIDDVVAGAPVFRMNSDVNSRANLDPMKPFGNDLSALDVARRASFDVGPFLVMLDPPKIPVTKKGELQCIDCRV